MYTEIRFTLNGEQKLYQGDPLRRLLDVLREDYGLTAVSYTHLDVYKRQIWCCASHGMAKKLKRNTASMATA